MRDVQGEPVGVSETVQGVKQGEGVRAAGHRRNESRTREPCGLDVPRHRLWQRRH